MAILDNFRFKKSVILSLSKDQLPSRIQNYQTTHKYGEG